MTSTTQTTAQPTVILVPGYWLGAWAWEDVAKDLAARGFRCLPLTLPGLDPADPQRATRTLADQADAIQAAIEGTHGEIVIVAHSGANGPVSLVLDRIPTAVQRVIWVDSGPVPDGGAFAPDLPEQVTELPLPDFESLAQQASLEGLSPDQLDRFRALAVAEPGSVARAAVHLINDARLRVPTTLVCCSLSSAQAKDLAAAGHPMLAEVTRLADVSFVDLPTGHWPMWSRSEELAAVIEQEASRTHS